MKITNVREFKNKATRYLREKEPVLVTRHGKVAGLLLPLHNPDSLPVDLRCELLSSFGDFIRHSLDRQDIAEEEILDDFRSHRKNRR